MHKNMYKVSGKPPKLLLATSLYPYFLQEIRFLSAINFLSKANHRPDHQFSIEISCLMNKTIKVLFNVYRIFTTIPCRHVCHASHFKQCFDLLHVKVIYYSAYTYIYCAYKPQVAEQDILVHISDNMNKKPLSPCLHIISRLRGLILFVYMI